MSNSRFFGWSATAIDLTVSKGKANGSDDLNARPGGRLRVGILGWGVIARECARRLTFLGFPVAAWARSSRSDGSVVVRSGNEGLDQLLIGSDILISALPKTAATEGILNAKSFERLPTGAHIINVGRGEHIVDD